MHHIQDTTNHNQRQLHSYCYKMDREGFVLMFSKFTKYLYMWRWLQTIKKLTSWEAGESKWAYSWFMTSRNFLVVFLWGCINTARKLTGKPYLSSNISHKNLKIEVLVTKWQCHVKCDTACSYAWFSFTQFYKHSRFTVVNEKS